MSTRFRDCEKSPVAMVTGSIAQLVRKSAHMQKLGCLVVYRTLPFVSNSASLSLATTTICTILL